MKVVDLAEEKRAQLSENDFDELLAALAYQYGLTLAHFGGVRKLDDFTRDELIEALMQQEIQPLGQGGYMIICDVTKDPIIRKYRQRTAN